MSVWTFTPAFLTDFVQSCNAEGFPERYAALLHSASAKSHLDLAMRVLLSDAGRAHWYGRKDDAIAGLIVAPREALFRCVLGQGETPERDTLLLYALAQGNDVVKDPRSAAYRAALEGALLEGGISTIERVLMAELLFVLDIFDGEAERGAELFFERLLTLNLHEANECGINAFLGNWCRYVRWPLEALLQTNERIWSADRYRALTPIERRSTYNWNLHVLWQVESYFNHPEWTRFYDCWLKNFYAHLDHGEIDEAMYVQFFIHHYMGNSFQTPLEWRTHTEKPDAIASPVYESHAKKSDLPASPSAVRESELGGGKKRVAMVLERLVGNAPRKVEYSVFKSLKDETDFFDSHELFVISMGYFEKSEDDPEWIAMFEDIGATVLQPGERFRAQGYYHSHLEKALAVRETVLDRDIDIAIFTGNHYDITDFLLASRCAPKQIYWCHGDFEFNAIGIDKRITHIGKGSVQNQSDYVFDCFDYQTDEQFLNPDEVLKIKQAEQIRASFPQDAVLLGTIGRLVKLDNDDFIETLGEILRQRPEAIYLACGNGNTDSIKARLRRFELDEKRFIFTGWVDPHVYGRVIDVYLNSFPEPSGEALNEFVAKNRFRQVINLVQDL